MSRDGGLTPADRVRRSDMEKWTPASRVKGLEFNSETTSRDDILLGGATADESGDNANRYATTDDGERIRLFDNGTDDFHVVPD